MNKYRTHTCGELTKLQKEKEISLSGWINKKRDHGNLLFIDLRDNFGITQCVIDKSNEIFKKIEKLSLETVIKITGMVIERSNETINKNISTGEIEVKINNIDILGETKELPMPVFSDQEYAEEIRLKYRFLDLRRKKIHQNIILRSKVISFIRNEMQKLGFLEFQTPILTSSSPEGARDFLVPSRLNPGKFYALPQAPQQFKQLTMVSGFDKYFQIAPCFRDEDARADRSPGEFYQLDLEMSFVEQEDVFNVVEKLLVNTFKNFSNKKLMFDKFPKISYAETMLKYGSDKPDLRNPLIINDITKIFDREDVSFEIFKKLIKSGSKARCIVTKNTKEKPRSFFDNIDKWAKDQGASGLAYFTIEKDQNLSAKGPVGKFFSEDSIKDIMKITNAEVGDSLFLACGKIEEVQNISSHARDKIAKEFNIGENYILIPFKGNYWKLKKESRIKICTNLYPVPDLDLPFLGVHFTRMIGGSLECGPNAVLAFAREGYKRSSVNFSELAEVLSYSGFLKLAKKDIKRYEIIDSNKDKHKNRPNIIFMEPY